MWRHGVGRPDDGGELPISSTDYRINDRIRSQKCRLIGIDGSQLGIFVTSEALRIADDQGLDLVEIAPNAEPPVCKIMDFGKYKYELSMKEKQARKHQSKVEIKEMKFRPKVDKHDYETKKRHILRFLDAGAKVKVTIMFRGREMAHPELGLNILERLAEELAELAMIETQPKLEGRNMHMLIAPLKKAPGKEAQGALADETDETAEPAAEE
jgi:translation initiation factor IF-3